MMFDKLQPENGFPHISLTLLGIVMEVSPKQPKNASGKISKSESGNVSDVRPEQKKDSSPMVITLFGIFMFVRASQR